MTSSTPAAIAAADVVTLTDVDKPSVVKELGP